MTNIEFEVESLQKKLLTLYFSGIYITSADLIAIAESLEIELPSKEREILMKYLFKEAISQNKLESLLEHIVGLLNVRSEKYRALTIGFAAIAPLTSMWVNKINSIKSIIFAMKRKSIYEWIEN